MTPRRVTMRIRRNDTHDIDRTELHLIRATHYLWSWLRKWRKSRPHDDWRGIEEAIETMIRVKREYRADLAQRRAAANAKTRERFERIAGGAS